MFKRYDDGWKEGKVVVLKLGWKLLNWAWLMPKKLEKLLREQGYQGNPYKPITGDIMELAKTTKEARAKPMSISHDITPHVSPYEHHIYSKYGDIHLFTVSVKTQFALGLKEKTLRKYFKCEVYFNIHAVFNRSQPTLGCGNRHTVTCQPRGGRERLAEGCSFRTKGD
ncbi:cytochrome P450 CYP72A219-like protein [Tanacetum coccineum]